MRAEPPRLAVERLADERFRAPPRPLPASSSSFAAFIACALRSAGPALAVRNFSIATSCARLRASRSAASRSPSVLQREIAVR